MTKKMRELEEQIAKKIADATAFSEGETKDIGKANTALDEADALAKELETLKRLVRAEKSAVPDVPTVQKSDGFTMMKKILSGKSLSDVEKDALITGTNATAGENYLIPEDVKYEINELRKTYLSARDIVTVVSTTSLSGSENYEAGTPAGLTAFDDGDDIPDETGISFRKEPFAIKFYGKLIPISNILIGAEKPG